MVDLTAGQGSGATDRSEEGAAWIVIGPTVALIAVLLVAPTLAMLALSFTDAELGVPDVRFIGIDAYLDLMSDRTFVISAKNTLAYVAMVTPAAVALGLILAMIIESDDALRGFFRSAFFLPVVSLIVAMATVWQYLMHPSMGPINQVLRAIGLPGSSWLSSSDSVLMSLAVIGIWQAVGFNMVLFLAGLAGIDRQLYHAAEIDGAKTAVDRFRTVTWPMLGPTTLFVVTITIINAVKVFETVKTLTEGGPSKSSEVLLWTIYQEGFVFLHLGTASAMAVVFVVVLLILILIQTWVADRRIHYS